MSKKFVDCMKNLTISDVILIVIAIIIIAVIILGYPYAIFKYMENPAISNWILLGTAIIIFCYTHETHLMKREMVKQNELSLMPAITVYNDADDLYIKNIGNGAALNIFVKDIISVDENEREEYTIKYEVPTLLPKEDKILKCKIYNSNGVEKNLPVAHALNPFGAETNFNVEIEYTNISGISYKSLITTGKDGIKIKSIKRIKSSIPLINMSKKNGK